MRGFLILSQNSNWIIFDLLFGQTTVQNWINQAFHQFSKFLGQKGVKCYSIWVLRPDLEFSHNLASFRTPFVIIFTFWNLNPPMLTEKLQSRCGRSRYWSILLRMVWWPSNGPNNGTNRMHRQKTKPRYFLNGLVYTTPFSVQFRQ